ncbi:MAG: transglycosylase SLT domain-containing protein [Candidatus Krumholzibacteria bacterium]|nr:transglycosylase SLT domain-containing protein [Candidatus Krumholzibacteria bacterium]
MEIPGKGSLDLLVTDAGDRAGQVRLRRSLDQAAGSRSPQSPSEQAALEESAKEFEGVFLNTLLKAMRQTVPENELFNGGGATKFYRQMHDAEIAKTLATGHSGMGIADMIVRQLSRESSEVSRVPGSEGSVLGPPAPKVLARYRDVISLGPESVAGKRLALLASQQGAAVADTLKRFDREIQSAARKSGLDPALILSVVMEESGGDPGALSEKGALGLMQLMPDTASELGVENRADAGQSLLGGAKYLADMLEQFGGKLDVALAAYNAGPGTVDRLGGKIPPYPETRGYVDRVLDRYQKLGGGTHLASTGK